MSYLPHQTQVQVNKNIKKKKKLYRSTLDKPTGLFANNSMLYYFILSNFKPVIQGFQLSRIERGSPAWTLFLPVSRQACKISRINEKNPTKHVKSPSSINQSINQLYFHINIKHNINIIYIQQKFKQRTKATLYGGVINRPGRPERDYP